MHTGYYYWLVLKRTAIILLVQDTCEFLVAELPDGQLDLQDSYVIDEVSMMQYDW